MQIETKECRYGKMSYLPYDVFIGRSLRTYGEYSEVEVMLFKLLLRPRDIAVDVGANIGAFTVPLAQAVGATGTVHAFEPQREIHELLSANIAQNDLRQAIPHREAVGAVPGTVTVPPKDYDAADNFGGVELGGYSGEEVPLVTVDGLDLPGLRLIKIDVEGMETAVIRGAQQTIRRYRPAIYVENDRSQKSAELISELLALNYRLWWYVTPMFNANNSFGMANNIFGIWSINMIGFPRAGQIALPFAEVAGPGDVPRLANGEVFKFQKTIEIG